jgi:hypothetical protein
MKKALLKAGLFGFWLPAVARISARDTSRDTKSTWGGLKTKLSNWVAVELAEPQSGDVQPG